MEIGETLYVTQRPEWRRWLEENHAERDEIWLVYYRKSSDMPTLPSNDAVDEALCFGWIDSIIKKHGPQSRIQRFTPRRLGSPLSELNKVRMRRLHDSGLLTPAGMKVAAPILDEPFTLPADIRRALVADPKIWSNFEAFPESYKRIRIGFIEAGRRQPDVFKQRLDYFLGMTAKNKCFGMVQ